MTKILSIFILMLFPVLVLSQEVKPNAAILIEEVINDIGIEEAQKKFEEILGDTSQFILLENEFNNLGYNYLRQRKINEAIAVLKMNVKAFPGSWNVYDSLGEVYTWNGSTDEAIENFEKSLELNPANENASKNLSRIFGTRSDHENETKSEFLYQCGAATGINEPYFGEEPPGVTPKLFAPGIISTHGHFEFACTFSPDGKKLYFGTSRAKPGADQPSYGIWVMDREGSAWSIPEYATDGMYVSATQDGSLYLTDIEGLTEGGVIKLVLKNGVFEKPVRLGRGVNHPTNGIHPFILPNEEFILFDCQREDGYGGEGDLYVSFRDDGENWSDAVNLGEDVNGIGVDFCASVSPDGKYIFYTKNRDIYWVSTSILETRK